MDVSHTSYRPSLTMPHNPYESPRAVEELGKGRAPMSWVRFPMAGACALIVLIHGIALAVWSLKLVRVGLGTPSGHLAAVYIPLSFLGMLGFGTSGVGLLRRRPTLVAVGTALCVAEVVLHAAAYAVLLWAEENL